MPVLAVGSAVAIEAEPDPAAARMIGDTSRAACIARAEHIVSVLGDCYIRKGWHECFDRERAARFLENVRTFDEHDGADPRFVEILEWMSDHDQCLDWLFMGKIRGMVVRRAENSPVASQLAAEPDPIFALIEAYREAYAQHGAACDALGAFEEHHPGTDHPEWGDLDDRAGQACHALAEAARKLCHTAPTTLAGLAAVLNLVISAHAAGDDILNTFADDEERDFDSELCKWPFFRTVLQSVEQMAGAQS